VSDDVSEATEPIERRKAPPTDLRAGAVCFLSGGGPLEPIDRRKLRNDDCERDDVCEDGFLAPPSESRLESRLGGVWTVGSESAVAGAGAAAEVVARLAADGVAAKAAEGAAGCP